MRALVAALGAAVIVAIALWAHQASGADVKPLINYSAQALPIKNGDVLQIPSLGGSGTRCLQTDNSGNVTTFTAGCSTTTTPGGTSGQIEYNNAGAFGGFTASGDATINTSTGAVSVTKTGGVAFGYFATGTNAVNLTGTMPASVCPAPSASTVGCIESITSASHEWVSYIDTSGVPHQSQPAFTDLSGSASSSQISTNLSAAIDAAVGSTRGAILERGASAWSLVAPASTTGYVLTSNGTGADPSYQAAGGSGGTSNPFPVGSAYICVTTAAPPLTPCPSSLAEGSVIARTDVGYAYSQFLPATSVPARVQEQAAVGTFAATLSAAPTPGNYMVAMGWSNSALPSVTSGWTSYQTHNQVSADPYAVVAYRLVHHGDTAAQTPFTGSATCASGVLIIEVSGVDMVNFTNSVEYQAFGVATVSGPSSVTISHTTAVANEEGVVLTGATRTSCNLGGVNPTLNSGWTNVVAANGGNLAGEADVVGSEAFPASSSSVTATTSYFTAGTQGFTSFLLMLQPSTDQLDTGPQQVSYLDTVESGGVTITSGPGPRSLNFTSGLSATVDSDNNVTVTPTNGVNCSGSPSGSFATTNGIVTHC